MKIFLLFFYELGKLIRWIIVKKIKWNEMLCTYSPGGWIIVEKRPYPVIGMICSIE
jgi:hypothetical protein